MAKPKKTDPQPESPRTKRCETCEWWDHHQLTDMTGYCHKDPQTINKNSESWCSYWQTKFR